MRLLLATSQFAPELGGVPRLLSQLCANLPGDIELCVLSVQQQPPSFYADYDAASPHPIERVPAQGRPGWTSLRFASRLGSIIRTWQPDVILCGVAYPTAILTYATTRLWRVPYVVYTHSEDVTISRQGKRWALGRALRGANGLIAVSQFTRQEMQAFGVPPDRVGVIHPGIGVEQFALASRPPELAHLSNRFLLLTVARWVRRKGIDTVLQSMTRVLQQVPNAHYVLVGSGPDEGYFRDLARELGLNEHVTFAGRISDQSLPAFYQACDLFVMPTRPSEDGSEVEGFGIVFLEAAAAGKPVVAGRSGGVADAVLDGETGLLVDPLDMDAVTQALLRLAHDPELGRRLGEAGRERARREHSAAAFAARVAEVLLAAQHGLGENPDRVAR